MVKILLKTWVLFTLTLLIASDQQLSKKMGSHVNGERYKGSYKNGLKHGHGNWIHPDGDTYRGKFKSGMKRGMGVYTFKNGEEYRGHFKRDQQHGVGKYTYENGEIFYGEFKNNIRDGQGYIIFRGDTIKSGIWRGDEFIKKIRLKNVNRHLRANYPKYKKTKNAPKLSVSSVSLNLKNGKDTLETNETAELIIQLLNNGKGNAQGIEIFFELNNYSGGLIIDGLDIIHKLMPGGTKEVRVSIYASEVMLTESVLISAYVTEVFGNDINIPNLIEVHTKSLTSPELILTDIKINDKSNKNGLIEPAEVIEATMYVRNNGQQMAEDVNLAVLYGDFVFNTGKSSFNLGNIKQNQKKKIQFSFFAMSEADKELPISFEIKESRSKFDQIIPSGLGLNRNNKNPN
tara:strand:+ start:334 stop:1539 length:1206 start_codon:yes stop_codon:yes gene_type:complete